MTRRVPAGVLLATSLTLGAAACSADEPTALPRPSAAVTGATGSGPVATPSPDDRSPAVPDADAGRSVSPAQGSTAMTVDGRRPGGEAGAVYDAYVGWVRASLSAFAAPGTGDGELASYADPRVVTEIRGRVRELVLRGWAEYGTASVSGVAVQVRGAAGAVTACLDLSGVATRDAAGRLAGKGRPVRSAAAVERAGSRWLVTADRRTPLERC